MIYIYIYIYSLHCEQVLFSRIPIMMLSTKPKYVIIFLKISINYIKASCDS